MSTSTKSYVLISQIFQVNKDNQITFSFQFSIIAEAFEKFHAIKEEELQLNPKCMTKCSSVRYKGIIDHVSKNG